MRGLRSRNLKMARITVSVDTQLPVSFSIKERGTEGERFISYNAEDGVIEFSSAGPGIRDYELRMTFGEPQLGIVSFAIIQHEDIPSPVPQPPIPIPVPIPTPVAPLPVPVPVATNYCKEGPYLFGSDPIRVLSPGSLQFQFHGVEISSIAWWISGLNGSKVREGVVNPVNNTPSIQFDSLPRGSYELFIRGYDCVSEASSAMFWVESAVQPVPTPNVVPVPPVPSPVPPVPNPVPVPIPDASLSFTTNYVEGVGSDIPEFGRFSLDSNNLRFTTDQPFSGLLAQGFDLNPMSGQTSVIGSFEPFTNWDQSYLTVPGVLNNVVSEGNKTYFFSPPGYIPDYTTPMFDFHLRFPEFALPAGKTVVMESGIGIRDSYGTQFDTASGFSQLRFDRPLHVAMLSRGVTHVKDLQDTRPQNTMKFLGDAWLLAVGYPADGYTPAPDHTQRVIQWANSTPVQVVFDYWKLIHLQDPNGTEYIGNVSYYLWDFELPWAWIIVTPNHFKQFMDLVYQEVELNFPNLQVSVWRKASLKPLNFSPTYNYFNVFNTVKNSNFTPQQLKDYMLSTPIAQANALRIWDGLFDSPAVQQVSFYQSFLRSRENPAQLIFEYLINKKASPRSKVLLIYWSDIETVEGGDFGTITKNITVNGNTRPINFKPRVGNSTMQTMGVWSVAFADGVDLWEIVAWNPDLREWLYRDPLYPVQNKLPNGYPYIPIKNIDWFMRGVWAVSVNRDIIDASTQWNFVNNNAWVLHSNDEIQDPVIGWKLSQSGSEALVIISDFSEKNPDFKIHNVIINGAMHQVKTYYRFTTVCRIQL